MIYRSYCIVNELQKLQNRVKELEANVLELTEIVERMLEWVIEEKQMQPFEARIYKKGIQQS